MKKIKKKYCKNKKMNEKENYPESEFRKLRVLNLYSGI